MDKKQKKQKTIFSNYRAGDFLIRVKNAGLAGLSEINLDSTKFVLAIAKSLKEEGFLDSVEVKEGKLIAKLKFTHKKPFLMDLRLVSKPGLRIYADVDKLKSRKAGSSILILSTPQGVMSGAKAIKKNFGGEVIAEVW